MGYAEISRYFGTPQGVIDADLRAEDATQNPFARINAI